MDEGTFKCGDDGSLGKTHDREINTRIRSVDHLDDNIVCLSIQPFEFGSPDN